MSKLSRIATGLLLLMTFLGLGADAFAQAPKAERPDDVTTLDSIIKAYYKVVSGPAGEAPDFDRDSKLHHPNALISVASVNGDGKPQLSTMSLRGFYDRFGGTRRTAFYEWEIHRRTERFGNMANVWSTYAASEKPGGEPFMRGINNIQLFYDGERWWIVSWIYDSERPENPIPKAYLSDDR